MADRDLSISSISNQRLTDYQAEAQVAVQRKQLDQQGEVAKTLIEAATETVPPPGVGTKLNVVA